MYGKISIKLRKIKHENKIKVCIRTEYRISTKLNNIKWHRVPLAFAKMINLVFGTSGIRMVNYHDFDYLCAYLNMNRNISRYFENSTNYRCFNLWFYLYIKRKRITPESLILVCFII